MNEETALDIVPLSITTCTDNSSITESRDTSCLCGVQRQLLLKSEIIYYLRAVPIGDEGTRTRK